MTKVCPVCSVSYPDAVIFCPTDGSSLRAAEAEGDLIGTVVADRYLVTDLLGEGGMGTVFLARHVRLPQQAAIKVLRPAMLRDPAAVARFNREAANASRIEHEHIARVFDYGESADGIVYLAMEYVPGRTLKQIIAVEGALAPERAASLTRQIGKALDAAHRLGIVHRDLKPDNVMVIEDAETGDRCKVVDFGIAKAVGGTGGEIGLTKTGFVIGTPEFMSPEQLLGGEVDHRSDVYALALLSFQCLTGVLPFDSTTPERAMTARLVEQPKTLANVVPQVAWPDEVQSVFDRGLAKEMGERFESAGAFARALELAVAHWRSADDARVSDRAAPTFAANSVPTQAASPVMSAAGAIANGPSTAVPPASFLPEDNPSGSPARGRGLLIATALVAMVGVSALVYTSVDRGDADAGNRPLPTGIADNAPPQIDDASARDSLPPTAAGAAPRGADDGTVDDGSITSARQPQAANTVRSQPEIVLQSNKSRQTIPPPAAPPPAVAGGPDDARLQLDSLSRALNPATATPFVARRAVAALRALMPRLGTAEDSAWAFIRQAEAHFIMTDERSACVAIKAATPLARNEHQHGVIELMTEALSGGC